MAWEETKVGDEPEPVFTDDRILATLKRIEELNRRQLALSERIVACLEQREPITPQQAAEEATQLALANGAKVVPEN